MSTDKENGHVRRVHYSGKYPKRYEEKYKELNPEKYADPIEHVIEKGSTPAVVLDITDALALSNKSAHKRDIPFPSSRMVI